MKHTCINYYVPYLFICVVLVSCSTSPSKDSVLKQFNSSKHLTRNTEWHAEEDSIGVIEGLAYDHSNLIVYDLHSGDCYSLFDASSGRYIARFGKIGQGPLELPRACFGHLSGDNFVVFNDQVKIVMKYHLDSLRMGKENGSPVRLMKYDIPDAYFSRLIPVDDAHFLGAGAYQGRDQYLLFDQGNHILHSGIRIYNAADASYDVSTKYLSNQGCLVKHPDMPYFAYSLNFSSNIDFFELSGNTIQLIKSLRLGDPAYHPNSTGNIRSADVTGKTIFGYIDVCATRDFVYALYSDQKVFDKGLRNSRYILVYNWSGDAVAKLLLDTDAFYITVNEDSKQLYTAIKNEDGSWGIAAYNL